MTCFFFFFIDALSGGASSLMESVTRALFVELASGECVNGTLGLLSSMIDVTILQISIGLSSCEGRSC